ncbi:MAG: DUF4355 domain-containing protein, partial [Oscillospiraceae bacterium]|nr:DUF4355 domain-containing protein [Oscillospiraceae bacterium]
IFVNDTENTVVSTTETAGNPGESGADTGTAQETEKSQKAKTPELTAESVSEMIQAAIANYTKQQEQARSEAEKLAGMNESEKLAYERDQYKTELENLKNQVVLAQMQGTARAILAEKNIHAPDELIAMIVTADAETTKSNVARFAEMYTKAVENGIWERMKSGTPRTGTVKNSMTKEQILAIKDNKARIQAINENMQLFA